MLVAVCTDGRKDRPKHGECYAKVNKFEKMVHVVGFTIGIYYNARTYERQIYKEQVTGAWERGDVPLGSVKCGE
jgi:lysyl-tRNA synthetase class I